MDGQPSMESSSQSTDAGPIKKIASPRRTSNTIQAWAQSPKHASRVATPSCGTSPCGTRTTRPNEPKTSVKLFSNAEMFSYAEMNPETVGTNNNVSHFTEEETTASEDASLESSILRRLTACAGGGLPNHSEVKIAVGEARAAWDLSDAKVAVGEARAAMACGQRENDRDFHYPGPGASSLASEDSEAMRVRRLTSWGTIGTVDTSYSEATFGVLENNVDDDGNPIDPKLLEKMMSEKRQSQKKRTVKFEYPPISSVRECPRHHVEDLPMLFFTEEELYQIEDDRECTEIADDVEVVAVSSSVTYDNPVSPSVSIESRKSKQSSGSSSVPSPSNKLSAHIPSPRMWSKRKGSGTYFSFSQQEDSKSSHSPKSSLPPPIDSSRGRSAQPDDPSKPRRRASTPRRGSEPENGKEEDVTEGIEKKDDSRLIKSVQIYLRERSTAPKSPSKPSR
jgi:hypothetical protein